MKKHPIGFYAADEKVAEVESVQTHQENITPRKSLVKVYFETINRAYVYYNDTFNLKVGDYVFVEGKLEGERGRVESVTYSFKIKLSDYKRVISVSDTTVSGDFYLAGSHIVTFDRSLLSHKKARTWFLPPESEEGFEEGEGDEMFPLGDFYQMGFNEETGKKGHSLYLDNAVVYLELDKTRGRAIIEGSKFYEVEFFLSEGIITGLKCSCYSAGTCKHTVAVMYQLSETIKFIEEEYGHLYKDYFAAMSRTEFLGAAIGKKRTGKISF